jgi:hypothetical protein
VLYLGRLERLARDKHSSLLRKSANYGRNKLYDTGPRGLCFKGALLGKNPALHANIRVGWKALPGTNALAYYKNL